MNKNRGSDLIEPLRLWPGILFSVVLISIRYLLPVLIPRATMVGVLGGILLSVGIFLWWFFFSRASKIDKWGAFLLIVVSLTISWFLLDKSIATANMGMMYILYSLPVLSIAFAAWAYVTRKMPVNTRRITMALTIMIAAGFWIFLRTDGMTGDVNHNLNWRWAKTSEENTLRQTAGESLTGTPGPDLAVSEAEWPGFRGKNRDGIVHGIKINSDWNANPPVELWRRPVGPGCSSFARFIPSSPRVAVST